MRERERERERMESGNGKEIISKTKRQIKDPRGMDKGKQKHNKATPQTERLCTSPCHRISTFRFVFPFSNIAACMPFCSTATPPPPLSLLPSPRLNQRVERVLTERHALLTGQQAHGAVEAARPREVEQRARNLVIRHNNQVQPPVALAGPEPHHAHKLLLRARALAHRQHMRHQPLMLQPL